MNNFSAQYLVKYSRSLINSTRSLLFLLKFLIPNMSRNIQTNCQTPSQNISFLYHTQNCFFSFHSKTRRRTRRKFDKNVISVDLQNLQHYRSHFNCHIFIKIISVALTLTFLAFFFLYKEKSVDRVECE